ncbi:PREDICTED: E3 ubiquitin-protein ligase SGR9, amyloplastic-like [Camelina sativa]|uniref:RING-type E3 ubiquitin transferase n=1 Tax=Camelina sativa TaxID=90675 RepID=A0ABM0TBR2_CAMSA|nr:PREDICTED: E3 ubiquitin-protein ligase SGR9, amyloplastic-like [Camelina sativa]
MEEENTTIIMASLSTLSPSHLTNLTHSILSISHHHRRRLAAVLSSPTLFSLTLRHLLSLSLPDKTHLIANHLISLLHPLLINRKHHSLTNMKLRDLDAVVLLLFLCETHQLDPDVLETSADNWREILGNMCSDTMLSNNSGLWTCDAGILMPYIETLVRCKRFVDIMGGYNHPRRGDQKQGYEVPAARAAVLALRAVEVFKGAGEEVECVICKEEMSEGRDVCEMPCQHSFHWKCILPWLSKKNTCPSCRFQLPTDDVFSEIQRLWEILVKSSDLHVA